MPTTIDDIAKELGISKTTVSRALNNKSRLSEDTRKKVLEAAEKLNYRPNKLASGLRSKQSMAIGMVISDLITGHFYSEIFHGVQDVATQNNYSIILGCSEGNADKEKKLIDLFYERKVDGIIVVPSHDADISSYLFLKNENIPFVFIDKYIPQINTDIVTTDDVFGAYQAVNHLIKLGHQKIAILSGPEYPCVTIEKRIQGYRNALRDHNIHFERIIQTEKNLLMQKYCGYMAVKEYLKTPEPKATAIFAINDSLAIGAMKALREDGIRVPEDMAVIGYNNDDITEYLDILLTTVSQPKYEIGQKAISLLLNRIKNKGQDEKFEYINLKPELIIRESCGAKSK